MVEGLSGGEDRIHPVAVNGSIDATTGRELARLPRGNQREVAAAVKRRGLSTRETQTLVCYGSDYLRDFVSV